MDSAHKKASVLYYKTFSEVGLEQNQSILKNEVFLYMGFYTWPLEASYGNTLAILLEYNGNPIVIQ